MCKSYDSRTRALFQKLLETDRLQMNEGGLLVVHLRDLDEDAARNAKSIVQGFWERMARNKESEVELEVALFHSEFDADLKETRIKDGQKTVTFEPDFDISSDKNGRMKVVVSNCSTPGGYRPSRNTTSSESPSSALEAVLAAANAA